MSESSTTKKFKVNDRVRKVSGTGCLGVVKDVRLEISATTSDTQRDKTAMINVLWDSGTLSYHGASTLEAVKS